MADASSDQISAWYRQYLGRDANPDEIQGWTSGAYGPTDAASMQSQIAQSGEAQDYAKAHGGGGGSGGGGGGGGGITGGGGGSTTSGNTWGAGTTDSPFGPWQGSYTAPSAQPLPDAPTFTPPAYQQAPAFAYDASHPAPTYTPPPAFSYGDFTAPTYTPPPAFSYADFQAPTAEEALNDPGYQFRTEQGQQALQNAASARGTLNDSGTLKALIDYGQGAASQEYANVYNRDLGTYGTNRANAFDTYSSNVKTQYTDPYALNYQAAMDQYTQNRGNALGAYNTNYQTQYQDPYNAALTAWNTGRSNALNTYQTNYQTQYADPYAASYKAAQDAFAPQILGYQTQAQNLQHQNDLANTNSWNDYSLGWQDYEARRGQGINFALGS